MNRNLWFFVGWVIAWHLALGSASEGSEIRGDLTGDFVHEVERIQVDSNPINRYGVHRLSHLRSAGKGSILLLGGSGMGFEAFLASEGPGKIESSLPGFLAGSGFAVYGYDPRELAYLDYCTLKGRPRRDFQASVWESIDCSAAKDWGMEQFLADLDQVIARIETREDGEKPILAGVSLGAIAAYEAVNRWPERFSGLWIWEGFVSTNEEEIERANADECDKLEKRVKKGEYLNTVSLNMFKNLAKSTRRSPQGWNPLGVLLGGSIFSTNEETLVAAATMNMGDPPLYGGEYQFLIRSSDGKGFEHCSMDEVLRVIDSLAAVESLTMMRDYTCRLAEGKTAHAHYSQISRFTGKVLALEMGFGMGKHMDYSLTMFDENQVTKRFFPELAHGDFVFSASLMERALYPVLSEWLRR